MSELAQRAKKAATWSIAEVLLRQVVQFAISIVLARLLVPEDFGAIAVVALIVSLAGIFIDGGLGQALIQKRFVSATEIASVFWFNVVAAIVLAGLVAASASSIARYFESPVIGPLMSFMSLSLVLLGAQSVHRAMLTKELRFKALGLASFGSTILSGLISVFLAKFGYGVWSLAWQTVISAAVSGVLLALAYKLPRFLAFSISDLRGLLRYGVWIVLGSVLNAMKGGFITLLLGKYFSFRELGLYSRAEGTKNIPIGLLSASLERVILPVLAQAADDRDRLRRGARRALLLMMLFSVPVMMGLATSSDLLITVLFGAKWLDAAPYLTALCVASIFAPLHIINVQILLALGYSKKFFYLDFAKFLIAVVITVIASRWGVMAVAWAQVLIAIISWVVNTSYSKHFIGYGFSQQLVDILPTIVAGLIVSLAVSWIMSRYEFSGILGLFVLSLCWITLFFFTAVIARLGALSEVRQMLAEAMLKRTHQ